MTDPRIQSLLLQELQKRAKEANTPIDVLANSFPQQRAFIEDPAKLKAALCTRRAGKSWGTGLYLVQEGLKHPRSSVLYLALTRASAKKTMVKDIFTPIFEQLKIEPKINKTDLTFTLPNGSIIYLSGADASIKDIKRQLGTKSPLIVIDESQDFTDLKSLVTLLLPTVANYNGCITLIGTPSNYVDTYFHEVTRDDNPAPGWKVHRWTWQDNPFDYDNNKLTHDNLLKLDPLTETTNEYKQLWLGKWAIDESALCYHYSKANLVPSRLFQGFYYVLGVDLGWGDDTAFCVMAYSYDDPCAYIVYTYKKKGMTFTDVANKTKELAALYPFVKYIIDGGGGGKQGVEEMKAHHDIPWQSTPKSPNYKFTAIKLMTSELITQRVLISPGNEQLLKEWDKLVWDDKNPTKEKPSRENHLCDAALYAFIACKHYHGRSLPLSPTEERPTSTILEPPPPRYSTIQIDEEPLAWLDYGDL